MAFRLVDRWTSGGQGLGIGLIAYSVNTSYANAVKGVIDLIESHASAEEMFGRDASELRAAVKDFSALGAEREFTREVELSDGPMLYWIHRTSVARHKGAVVQSLVRQRGEVVPVSRPV